MPLKVNNNQSIFLQKLRAFLDHSAHCVIEFTFTMVTENIILVCSTLMTIGPTLIGKQ